jgi:superfamily I DNA/RNA helicase
MTNNPSHAWSEQQQTIFHWFETSNVATNASDTFIGNVIETVVQNLIVRARAGCAKTTSIIEGVKRSAAANPTKKILICSFSKDITAELAEKIGNIGKDTSTYAYPSIDAKTLHAVGFACVRQFRDNIRLETGNVRANNLAVSVCGKVAPDAILKLVAKLCTKGREIAPHATKVGDLSAIAIEFECEPEAAWHRCKSCGELRAAHDAVVPDVLMQHDFVGFDTQYVEEMALKAMEVAANVQSGDSIDYSDMLFLPVRNGWMTPIYDEVVVDEAQDMTNTQLELARGVCRPTGRICIVGDDRQAVYGFRGADSNALDRLKAELNAAELGLKMTYRCGRSIVAEAQKLVPDFQAAPTNSEGTVSDCAMSQLVALAGPSDFILSRVNAPLVSIAMKLLRSGKRTRVAGKEIGKGLQGLVWKLKTRSIPELLSKISAWEEREIVRLTATAKTATNGRKEASKAKIEAVKDQAEMLISLTDGAKNVTDVEDRIEALFSDDGLGAAGVITCSSVHRAKGKETKRVFVLADTLRNNNIEELNITYVAITRAKESLVYVHDDEN